MIKMNNEVKTGMMVVVCLAALLILTINLGNFKLFKKGYEVNVTFAYTTGIDDNAPVRVCGVDAGHVQSVELTKDERGEINVTVGIWLADHIKVRNDSFFQITMLGLMGDKYIEIYPSDSQAPYLKDGDTVAGKDPFRLEKLIDMGEQMADKFESVLVDVDNLTLQVNDILSKNRENVDEMVLNLKYTTENFKEFSEDLKKNPWKLLFKPKDAQ